MSEENEPVEPATAPTQPLGITITSATPWQPGMKPVPRPVAKRLLTSLLTIGTLVAICSGLALAPRAPHLVGGFLALAVFLMASYGASMIAVGSDITIPIREALGRIPFVGKIIYEVTSQSEDPSEDETEGLLSCIVCTGTWIGAFIAALGISVYPVAEGLWAVRDFFVHGVMCATFCWAVQRKLG